MQQYKLCASFKGSAFRCAEVHCVSRSPGSGVSNVNRKALLSPQLSAAQTQGCCASVRHSMHQHESCDLWPGLKLTVGRDMYRQICLIEQHGNTGLPLVTLLHI